MGKKLTVVDNNKLDPLQVGIQCQPILSCQLYPLSAAVADPRPKRGASLQAKRRGFGSAGAGMCRAARADDTVESPLRSEPGVQGTRGHARRPANGTLKGRGSA